MREDKFIGKEFPTPKGGVLTVVGSNGLKGNKKKYICKCSICSEDEDLYPFGSISSVKSSLTRNLNPCGCAVRPSYSKVQSLIRMQRVCSGTKYTVLTCVKRGVYSLHCEFCSKDQELWPDGSITSTRHSIEIGTCPCGCAMNPRWTKQQVEIRVKRSCIERSYIFHGFKTKYTTVNKTFLDLENPFTGNRWQTTTIGEFLLGTGDPLAARERVKQSARKPDKDLIESFISTGGFLKGTEFYRNTERFSSEGYQTFWDYTCPLCSVDKYVTLGLCSGVFTSSINCLQLGHKSCRCSTGYRWTKEQRRYQLEEKLRSVEGTFIEWVGEYKNSGSRFKYKCFNNLTHEISINGFINGNSVCTCMQGFNQSVSGNFYITHWFSEDKSISILKFGITNREIKLREQEQAKRNKPLKRKLLFSWTHEAGKKIINTESAVKDLFKPYRVITKNLLPDGYTEAVFYDEVVLDQMKDFISSRLGLMTRH